LQTSIKLGFIALIVGLGFIITEAMLELVEVGHNDPVVVKTALKNLVPTNEGEFKRFASKDVEFEPIEETVEKLLVEENCHAIEVPEEPTNCKPNKLEMLLSQTI